MSDQPENPNAETTEFAAVGPAPSQTTQPAVAAEAKTSNRRVIMAAVAGAIGVAIIALAGVVGFAIGSHHSNNRAGFGPGDFGQIAQNFERHHDQMMDGYGQQLGQGQTPNNQQQGPGQWPQGMMNQQQTQ